MDIPNLILPVFAVIVTGWLAGTSGYLPRSLSGQIVQFAYNVAMPALVFLTISKSPRDALLNWRFLAAFGGATTIIFFAVMGIALIGMRRGLASSAMAGTAASMTNTGFVALPILKALYGAPGVVPAAIATAFIAVAMFPVVIVLLEFGGREGTKTANARQLLTTILINPVMISTILGLGWSIIGLPLPTAAGTYAGIFADALTPCALFSIGLGLTLGDLKGFLGASTLLTIVKLLLMPLMSYGLAIACGLDHLYTVAAVVCSGVPTAKTAYMLSGEYRIEEAVVASTISISTLASIVTLLVWLAVLV
jgi:malonate transporter and related proteins